MHHGVRHLLVSLIVFLGLSGSVAIADTTVEPGTIVDGGNATNPLADDEVLPWPWDTECPFPWETIGGDWLVSQEERAAAESHDRFEFNIEYVAIDGTRYYEVKRFDEKGQLIARGRGYSAESVKIIRVAMIEVNERGEGIGTNYWAIVRAYQGIEKRSCMADLTTVITVRSITDDPTVQDIHYVIYKVDSHTNQENSTHKKTR